MSGGASVDAVKIEESSQGFLVSHHMQNEKGKGVEQQREEGLWREIKVRRISRDKVVQTIELRNEVCRQGRSIGRVEEDT